MSLPPSETQRNGSAPFLVKSKLTPPIYRAGIVPRTRLKEWIRTSKYAKLLLIRAPAGYGKTTTMTEWLAQLNKDGVATAWVTLDEADNDLGRFLSYLVGAFQQIDPDLTLTEAANCQPQDETIPEEQWLNLVDRLLSIETPFVLFLDDFEVIHNVEVPRILKRLLTHLPHTSRLIVGTRKMPDLGFNKLRAQGLLWELGVNELRFSLEETDHFLRQSRRLDLDTEDVGKLLERTEGWAAGLQLAALALTGREDGKGYIQSFSGCCADITDYLAEDVLSRLSEDVRSFLMQTSILDDLCGPLCDALTGRTDGEEMLRKLEQESLFVVSLDTERTWFRYHKVFSEFLGARLQRGVREKIVKLHRAAAQWFRREGRLEEAAGHFLEAGDADDAAAMIAECAKGLIRMGQVHTVVEWVEKLPPQSLERHAMLQLSYVWALVYRHRPLQAESVLKPIEERSENQPPEEPIRDEIFALKSLMLVFSEQLDRCEQESCENLERISNKDSFNWISTANIVGFCLITSGKFAEAETILGMARQRNEQVGSALTSAYTNALTSLSFIIQGQLKVAAKLLTDCLTTLRANEHCFSIPGSILSSIRAALHYELNELDEAQRLLKGNMEMVRQWGAIELYLFCALTRARICLALGNYEAAIAALNEAEVLASEWGSARVAATVRLERARMALQFGNPEEAEQIVAGWSDEGLWACFDGRFFPVSDAESPEILRLGLAVRKGEADRALPEIKTFLEEALGANRRWRALKLRLVLAEALHLTGNKAGALAELEKALSWARPEGYLRTFLDAGKPIGRLLRLLGEKIEGRGPLAEYLDRILKAMKEEASRSDLPPKEEPNVRRLDILSTREMDVLELVASGLSNRSISEQLFISEATVRFHLRNVNAKLNTNSRTQAVAEARRLKLIA